MGNPFEQRQQQYHQQQDSRALGGGIPPTEKGPRSIKKWLFLREAEI